MGWVPFHKLPERLGEGPSLSQTLPQEGKTGRPSLFSYLGEGEEEGEWKMYVLSQVSAWII
jgi:hypothetical protein